MGGKQVTRSGCAKKEQINPKYKLVCQFGTQEILFTESPLIPYPGPVSLSVEISNTQMFLREAARKHSDIKSGFIKCKSDCKKTLCICKRNNEKYLSHCQKGLKCSNGNECDVYENFKKMFPKWSDKHIITENDVFLSNACTVEQLTCFSLYNSKFKTTIVQRYHRKYFAESSDLMAILALARKCAMRERYPYLELLWSAFPCIWTEYREIWSISTYSTGMSENVDQNNSEHGHFLNSSNYGIAKFK